MSLSSWCKRTTSRYYQQYITHKPSLFSFSLSQGLFPFLHHSPQSTPAFYTFSCVPGSMAKRFIFLGVGIWYLHSKLSESNLEILFPTLLYVSSKKFSLQILEVILVKSDHKILLRTLNRQSFWIAKFFRMLRFYPLKYYNLKKFWIEIILEFVLWS